MIDFMFIHILNLNVSFSDSPNGLTVRQLFVFLKENIIFDIFENELTEMNVFTDEISKEYINKVPGNSYKIEKILKLFIKTKRCKDLIECMRKSSSHRHVFDRIQEYQSCEAKNALNSKKYVLKYNYSFRFVKKTTNVLGSI